MVNLTLEELNVFSSDQYRRFVRCQDFKRNSHDPLILSYIFSEILNLDVVFCMEMTGEESICLYAKVVISPELRDGDFTTRWAVLLKHFVPVIYPVIVLFEWPYAVLGKTSDLDSAQLA